MARGMTVTTGTEAGLGQMIPGVASGGIDARANPADFGATNAQYVGQAGQAIQQGADTLDKFARQDALITAQSQAFADQVTWHQKLRQMQQDAPPGAPGFTQSFNQQFTDWKKQQLDAAPNRLVQAALGERYNEMGATLGDKAADFEAEQGQKHVETKIGGMLDNALALSFTDPSQLGLVQKQMLELIGNAEGLPATAKEALQQKVTHAVNAAGWRGMMEQDPKGVMGALLTGNAPGLDFQDRFAILGEARALDRRNQEDAIRAVDLKLRLADRAEREQDKALKRQQDATERQGYQLANQGQLTPEWLQQNGQHLSPSSLNYLGQELQGAHRVTNPDVYADFHETIRNATSPAETDQALDAAGEAVRQGLIRPEDRDKLESLAQRTLTQDAKGPAWAKEGDAAIKQMSGYSDFNPANSGANVRAAAAFDAWHEWVRANPDADREKARKEWLAIGKSATLAEVDPSLASLHPSYSVPAAVPAGTDPFKAPPMDFQATLLKTRQAYEAGEIDQWEAGRQMTMIEEQQKAWQAKQQARQ